LFIEDSFEGCGSDVVVCDIWKIREGSEAGISDDMKGVGCFKETDICTFRSEVILKEVRFDNPEVICWFIKE